MSSDRELFDRIAERYCAKDLHAAASIARCHRLNRTLSVATFSGAPSVLEVGCGAGFSASYLAGRYRRYVGIDHSSELIELAKRYNASEQAVFQVADAADYEPGERFDVVLMIGVLHHLDDIPRVLAKMRGWLVPGGLLVANEPHPGNPLIRLARSVRKRVDPSYSSDQRELSAHQLRTELGSAGFELVRVVPQGVISTPFAEVAIGSGELVAPLVRAACALDSMLEARIGLGLTRISWNLIAVAREPGSAHT